MDTDTWGEIRDKFGLVRASRQALIGMAVVLVLVAVGVAHVLAGAATASDVQVVSQHEERTDAAPEAPPSLYVHVSGAVEHPGLYELAEGSRVADAVQAAGGLSEDAADDSVNLARVVEDGEHVIVPTSSAHEGGEAADAGAVAEAPAASSGLVNVNTATAEQLESLPGIGAATARKIVEDRAANGPFGTVGDLTRVSGIGERKLEAIADLVCV